VSIAGAPLYTNEAIATFLPSDSFSIGWAFYSFPAFIPENSATNIYGARLLNQQRINDAVVLVPPICEQQAIASYLDHETASIDKLLSHVQDEIKLLQELRAAAITDAVTGKIRVL
jgi:type I restriction enzyme S subunit